MHRTSWHSVSLSFGPNGNDTRNASFEPCHFVEAADATGALWNSSARHITAGFRHVKGYVASSVRCEVRPQMLRYAKLLQKGPSWKTLAWCMQIGNIAIASTPTVFLVLGVRVPSEHPTPSAHSAAKIAWVASCHTSRWALGSHDIRTPRRALLSACLVFSGTNQAWSQRHSFQ